MKLEVQSILAFGEPESGQIEFDVLANVSIGEVGVAGGEVFQFRVISPTVLAKIEPGTFVTNTLVLEFYSKEAVRSRLDKLLLHAASAQSWDAVIKVLSGLLRYEP